MFFQHKIIANNFQQTWGQKKGDIAIFWNLRLQIRAFDENLNHKKNWNYNGDVAKKRGLNEMDII